LSGFFWRKNSSMASFFRRGFQLAHSSDPSFRIVGRNNDRLRALRVCASSTHAMSKPSSDLIDSAVEEPASMLHLYRRLIELRRSHEALQIGGYRPIAAADELLLFVREHGGEKLLIALNVGQESMSVGFANGLLRGEILLSSFCDRDTELIDGIVNLRSDEGTIIKLAADAIVPA
jgi:glycosidase